ncbi:MAG: BatD family protein [Chloroflexota bacterium]
MIAPPALAQAPLSAEIDRATVTTDEVVTLTVTVAGDLLNLPSPDLSHLADFRVVGSSTSTQVSIINGNLSSQRIFVYRLAPLRHGKLVIPPLTVELGGQTYQTEPFTIEVLPGGAPPLPDQDFPSTEAPGDLTGQLFVEAAINNPTPYLGQQIVYTFRLYQAVDFIGQPDYQPPSFTNFWGQNILAQPHYNTTVNGRAYLITEIQTALFPANVGEITIDSAKLVIPGGFFEPDIVLQTEPVTVEVRPLPDPAPADFKGAVGQFNIKIELSDREGQVNEPLTLIVEIEGSGNIETLPEPALPDLPTWRVFDSQVKTSVEVQGERVYGTRRFERLVVPGQAGDYTIPPFNFTFFDPEAGQYRPVSSEPIPVHIKPGQNKSPALTVVNPDRESVILRAGDIRHIKPVPTTLRPVGRPVLSQPLYWSGWLAPALGVGGVWLWQKQRRRLAADVAYARRQAARRRAYKILDDIQDDGVDGYAAAHRALLGYLSDKLNRPTVGLTTAAFTGLLRDLNLDSTLVDSVRLTLEKIEIGRFAPVEKTAAQAMVTQTRQLIDRLEKGLRRG